VTDQIQDARKVDASLPAQSCDCHIHVFGDVAEYPVANPKAAYGPPPRSIDDAWRTLGALGFERIVLVQPTIYATDHRVLHDVLKAAAPGRLRGVAIVDDSVSDAEIRRLHEVGVRSARFNFWKKFDMAPSFATFHRSLDRIRDYGWCAKVFATAAELVEIEPELRKVRDPAVIDHMGGPEFARGPSQPACRLILSLLERENWWIMISNGDRSPSGPPWDDAAAIGRVLYAAAPERAIWGSDWPHVHQFIRPPNQSPQPAHALPSESAGLDLLRRYLPDSQALQKVLVDNPARLFGFA
jgi:2-pyrone-4,6-dicarboxylate lactonase